MVKDSLEDVYPNYFAGHHWDLIIILYMMASKKSQMQLENLREGACSLEFFLFI